MPPSASQRHEFEWQVMRQLEAVSVPRSSASRTTLPIPMGNRYHDIFHKDERRRRAYRWIVAEPLIQVGTVLDRLDYRRHEFDSHR